METNMLIASFRAGSLLMVTAVGLGRWSALAQDRPAEKAAPKSVLIVYHGGDPSKGPSPSLEEAVTDAFTQATPRGLNVATVARAVGQELRRLGVRCELRRAEEIRHPRELLAYDGLLIGSPVWFSNVSYPIKRFFDTHLVRIYEHRPGRLNDKVMSGFCTVMEAGESGPRGLQALMWGIEHLTDRRVAGLVVRTSDAPAEWQPKARAFAEQFVEALRRE